MEMVKKVVSENLNFLPKLLSKKNQKINRKTNDVSDWERLRQIKEAQDEAERIRL